MSFTIGISHGTGADCDSASCPCKLLSISSTIWTAAEHGDIATVMARVGRKDSLKDQLDTYGYTALHYAAQHNKLNVVRYLLRKGASVDKNTCGATALHRAAYAGHAAVCKALLAAGADVNAHDMSFGDGATPLHKAQAQGHIEIVQLLIEAGADTTEVNSIGVPAEMQPRLAGREALDAPSGHTDASTESFMDQNQSPSHVTCTEKGNIGASCSLCGNLAISFVSLFGDGYGATSETHRSDEAARKLICRACYKNHFKAPR